MTASLTVQLCGTNGLFVPLPGQTVDFAQEDVSGNWWTVCSATTDATGTASCTGTNLYNSLEINGKLPASGDVAAWSAVFLANSTYQRSSDYGQMPGVTQPGPGQPGTPPFANGPQIQVVPERYASGCPTVSQNQADSLFGLLTAGGNCQLVKIEADITNGVFAAATVVTLGGTFLETGAQYIVQAARAAEVAADAATRELARAAGMALTDYIAANGAKAIDYSGVLLKAVKTGVVYTGAASAGVAGGLGLNSNSVLTVGTSDTLKVGGGTTVQNQGVIYDQGTITGAQPGAGPSAGDPRGGLIVNAGSVPSDQLQGLGNGTIENFGIILGTPPVGLDHHRQQLRTGLHRS